MKLEELIKYIDWFQLLESEIRAKWIDHVTDCHEQGVGFNYGEWLGVNPFARANINVQEEMLEAMGTTRYFDVEGHDETWTVLSIFKDMLERIE